MGIASLVLGIIGLVLALIPSFGFTALIGVIMGIVALILGIIGRKQAVERQEKTGSATAGIVLGIIALVLGGTIFAACSYCQHKVGRAIEKEMKGSGGIKGIFADIFATQVCTELSPEGLCKDPKKTFPSNVPQLHAVYRTKHGGKTADITWYRETKAGGFTSRVMVHTSHGTFAEAGEGYTMAAGTCQRPDAGWLPGKYKIKVHIDSGRSFTTGFTIVGSMP